MDTVQLRQWDREHVWHPFVPMQEYGHEQPPIIVAGDGFELIDTDGNRYLDGVSSLWCNVHGHHVPEIDAAIKEQLDRIAHSTLLGISHVPAIELAQQLVNLAPPGLRKVFFSDDGSTAVEAALKMAYQFHQQAHEKPQRRNLFITLSGAYHGDTIGSVSLGGIDLFHRVYRDLLFETLQVPSPVAFRTPEGYDRQSYLAHCWDGLERTIIEHRHRVAAFVIEPLVQGAAGILVHPPGYLKRVRELTAEHGILLIADEVATGCGRTGTFFACQQEDVTPDLLCVAKGITGGYLPLAATLATDKIFNAFLGDPAEGRTFFHGHTYSGNPLAAAAAMASLRLFEKNRVLDNVRTNAEFLKERLHTLSEFPHVGEVRQRGIMIGIELVEDKQSQTPFEPALRMGHRVTLAARRRGAIIRPLGDVVVLMPPPALPLELLKRLCDITEDAIREVVTKPGRASMTGRSRSPAGRG